MEERKKGNGGFVLVIIVLLVICICMGSFIFINKNKLFNTNTTQTTEQNTTDKQSPQNSTKETVSEDAMTEKEALSLGQELWDYAYKTYWGEEEVWKRHLESNEYGGKTIVCDTTRDEVKTKFASDFVGKAPNYKYSLDEFIPKNGCEGAGRGSDQGYLSSSLSVKEIQENKITYDVSYLYCIVDACADGETDSSKTKKVPKEFAISKQDDNWLIQYFELPN